MRKPIIHSGQEWTFELIEEVYSHLERIAAEKYQLDTYPNQLEIISSEQMLDAYSCGALPIIYPHWSFGRIFIHYLETYKRGYMGLAYEVVINSDPCIAYLMEENTMLVQALVMAHACFGHNTVYKTNYLFKQWTDASSIIDYLIFAKRYVRECEEKYGEDRVEAILDAAHSLSPHGIDKFKRPSKLSAVEEEKMRKERDAHIQGQINDVWRTVPGTKPSIQKDKDDELFPKEPQENLLYFIEKNAPKLKDWERELIRIVRKVTQYFYPQTQMRVLHEGAACFFHYKLMHDLYDERIIDEGAMFEFNRMHSAVVYQRDYDDKYYEGNVYALGWNLFKEIERVSMTPTEDDIRWFGKQNWVGGGDWLSSIKFAIKNFKDESLIQQFLTPKLIRDFRLFVIVDDENDPKLEVSAIHDDRGYKHIRNTLSQQFNRGYTIPDIQIVNVDRWGDRSMMLQHQMINRRPLHAQSTTETLKHLSFLWGYPIKLQSIDQDGSTRSVYEVKDEKTILDIFLD